MKIARKAIIESRRTVYLAGSLGPTGEAIGYMSDTTIETIQNAFEEQIKALVSEGCDLLCMETFRHLQEMKLCLKVARKHFAGGIIAQMSFEDTGLLGGIFIFFLLHTQHQHQQLQPRRNDHRTPILSINTITNTTPSPFPLPPSFPQTAPLLSE